jgi:hypothetical protein
MTRHRWGSDDVCEICGIYRSGCSAGRTGWTRYYTWKGGKEIGARPPTCDPTARLGDSVQHVEAHAPLPRCPHGQALIDGAGERLVVPCGCAYGAATGSVAR